MNQLTLPKSLGALPAEFRNAVVQHDDLAGGITGGFGVVSLRGKTWRVKWQGDERVMMRPDGDGPRSSIEVVIIKASPVISKVYYEKGYDGETSAPPDCWSTNGQTPDPASSKRQSNTCAGCKWNAFGSKISEAGKASKACADSKRLAIVPLDDIPNEMFGGPMLLRVPAASLKEVLAYAQKLSSAGYPYFAVATRMSFDVEAEYPKLVFNAIRVLDADEAKMVVELQKDPKVGRILSEAVEVVQHDVEQNVNDKLFEQAPKGKPAASLDALVGANEQVDPSTGEVTPKVAATPDTAAAGETPAETEKRKRRTKAEMEAARAAEAAKAAPAPAPAPAPAEDDEEEILRKQLEAIRAKKAAQAAAAAAPAPAPAPASVSAPATDDGDDDDEFSKALEGLLPS
jgi:hypothetical protein